MLTSSVCCHYFANAAVNNPYCYGGEEGETEDTTGTLPARMNISIVTVTHPSLAISLKKHALPLLVFSMTGAGTDVRVCVCVCPVHCQLCVWIQLHWRPIFACADREGENGRGNGKRGAPRFPARRAPEGVNLPAQQNNSLSASMLPA